MEFKKVNVTCHNPNIFDFKKINWVSEIWVTKIGAKFADSLMKTNLSFRIIKTEPYDVFMVSTIWCTFTLRSSYNKLGIL